VGGWRGGGGGGGAQAVADGIGGWVGVHGCSLVCRQLDWSFS